MKLPDIEPSEIGDYSLIRNIPVLTREEERNCFLAVAQGSEKARDILVFCNQRLVQSLAARFARNGGDIETLIADGMLVLLDCINAFDVNHGARFSTYYGTAFRWKLSPKSNPKELPRAKGEYDEPSYTPEIIEPDEKDLLEWVMGVGEVIVGCSTWRLFLSKAGLDCEPKGIRALAEEEGVSHEVISRRMRHGRTKIRAALAESI